MSTRAGTSWSLLLILPLGAAVLLPGWVLGDDNLHLVRLFEQDVMIRAGHFPVRWYPDVAGGFGSPHPQYYAPLFYLVAQAFLLAGFSLPLSLKLAVVAALGAASWGIFLLVRDHAGAGGGLVAAALYSYAPYHLLDLFVRTAFSELMVFAALPWVLLAFERLARSVTPARIASAAAALGALCIAHTISLMLVPPLAGAWILALAWRAGSAGAVASSSPPRPARHPGSSGASPSPSPGPRVHPRLTFLAGAAAAVVLGSALAAFFVLPLAIEKDAVDTEIFAEGYFDYHRHFVAPSQLLWSAWGHGMSRQGLDDGVSFRLGALQMLGFIAAIVALPRLRRTNPGAAALAIYAGLVSVAGVFMTLPVSEPLWRMVPPLRFVQFPWRFLVLPALGMSLMGGVAVPQLWSPRWGEPGGGRAPRRRRGSGSAVGGGSRGSPLQWILRFHPRGERGASETGAGIEPALGGAGGSHPPGDGRRDRAAAMRHDASPSGSPALPAEAASRAVRRLGGRRSFGADPLPRWAAAAASALVILASAGMFGFRERAPIEALEFYGDHTDMRVRKAGERRPAGPAFTRERIREETLHWFDHLPRGEYPYPAPRDARRTRMEIANGRGEIEILRDDPVTWSARVRAAGPVLLRVNAYRFPGWSLRIDGASVPPGPPVGERPVLTVGVPAGEHIVEASFERTPSRWAGDLASLGALAVLLGLVGAGFVRRRCRGAAPA